MDLEHLKRVAAAAAEEGGRVILASGTEPRDREVKGRGDYVTVVDTAAEQAIGQLLARRTPGIPVVGEELGGRPGDAYWLVDPLDGTTNFLHGFPIVGVSVALLVDGRPAAGAVHAPFLATTFTAARGGGAQQDGRVLRVSDTKPEEAVVGTGFPFRRKSRLPAYRGVLLAAMDRFEDLRRPGAASLDLAWVAAGVFDGFFELGLSPWDVAAGALLVEEAGGDVSDWGGGDGYLGGDILAGNPMIHAALLDLARSTPPA